MTDLKLSPIKRLIAIGGNEDKADELIVLKRVVQEVNIEKFKVGVITTASQEAAITANIYTEVFKSLGASQVKILDITDRAQANDPTYSKLISKMDLIFLTGGDQLRLTSILGGTLFLNSIREHLELGKVVVGTSAGATVFSDTMIYDGKSEEGLIKGKVLTTPGFRFVDDIALDTHFMTRGRMGRLIQIVTSNPTCIGVGLGEDSGIILKDRKVLEVIGTGQVTIVDGGSISHSNIMDIEPGNPIAVADLRVHSLVNGYSYDLKARKFLTPLKNDKKN